MDLSLKLIKRLGVLYKNQSNDCSKRQQKDIIALKYSCNRRCDPIMKGKPKIIYRSDWDPKTKQKLIPQNVFYKNFCIIVLN